ncbi:MAG: DUF1847 domain-containing protein, partial [Desulfosalsimonas sp.]
MNKKKSLTQCAYCKSTTCYPLTGINESMPPIENAPVSCPMRRHEEVVRQAGSVYHRTNIREFARLASVQEAECYESGSNGLKTRIPRIEETTEFAAKCGYFRLGLAFCLGLRTEAAKVSRIFEAKGFEVASVCCKVGRTPKESLGISGEEKIRGADCMESMCNPVAQAHLLNTQQVDLAVMLGLCVGHDTL